MKNGLLPIYLDSRDYDFHATFGSTTTLPDNFSVDAKLTMPDQNADANPFECTDYAINDARTDSDKILYVHGYLYAKTLLLTGSPPTTQGVDIRDAFKAARVYGLLPITAVPPELASSGEGFNANWRTWPIELDPIAEEHKVGSYFNVQPLNGSWFEGIRSACFTGNTPVIMGTPWYGSWHYPDAQGRIDFLPSTLPGSWHAWKICGWKTIGGLPYLIGKSWQGKGIGDGGLLYFSQSVIEGLWQIHGTQAFVISAATLADAPAIQRDIYTAITTFLTRLLRSLQLQVK